MKKNIFKSFLFFLILFFSISIKSFAAEKSFTIDKLDINAVILPNGDVNITEQLSYNFTGNFNGIYRDYNLKGCSGCQINEVKIIDQNNNEYVAANNSSETDLTYEVSNSDGNKKLKLFCKSSDEIKTFIINYTIQNAAVKYSDVGQLYWNFYELNDEVDEIKKGSLNISLENDAFQDGSLSYTIYGDGSITTSDSPYLVSIKFRIFLLL